MSKHAYTQAEQVRRIHALRKSVTLFKPTDRWQVIQYRKLSLELADARTCYYATSPVFAKSYLLKAESDVVAALTTIREMSA